MAASHTYGVNVNQMIKNLKGFGLNNNAIQTQIENAIEQAKIQSVISSAEQNEARKQEQIDLIRGLLISKGLVLIDTTGDGNCFYYALQGYGLIKNKPELSVGTSFMRRNLSRFINKIKDQALKSSPNSIDNQIISQILSPEKIAALNRKYKNPPDLIDAYRNEIQEDKQWADDIDITILARELDKCIITHIVKGNGELSQPIPHSNRSNTCNDPIQISWTFGNHYSLLMPVDDPDYIALRDRASELGIPLELPLDPRLITFLKGRSPSSALESASKAAASSSSNLLPQYAKAAANNLGQLGLNSSVKSTTVSLDEYIHILQEQIEELKIHIDKSSKYLQKPKTEEQKAPHRIYLDQAIPLLKEKQAELDAKLAKRSGGTRKRKTHKLRKTRQKRNKNKSRRRL